MQSGQNSNQNIWKEFYREALLELDPRLLQSKLQTARVAIESRLSELGYHSGSEPREVIELRDAHRMLGYLQSDEQ